MKKVPAYRMGKVWKFRVSEVDEWVTRAGASPEEIKAPRPEGFTVTLLVALVMGYDVANCDGYLPLTRQVTFCNASRNFI